MRTKNFRMLSVGLLSCLSLSAFEVTPGAFCRVEGNKIIVDVPKGKEAAAHAASFKINLKKHASEHLTGSIRIDHSGLESPDDRKSGILFQISYRADDDSHDRMGGAVFKPSEGKNGIYHFGITLDPHAEFCTVKAGLKNTSGKAVFDLDSLKFEPLFKKENADHLCEYSDAVRNRPVHRGVMSPGHDQANEENFKDLKAWNVNLYRLQLNCSEQWAYHEPVLYDKFIREKIDHVIPKVLELGKKYGIKVIIDLHMTPGSSRQTAELDGMYNSDKSVKRFVEIWTEIATKFKDHPALYAYDLANEPRQMRRGKYDYLQIQRMAAEAIRKIDPETPISIESNMMDSPLTFYYLSPLKLKNIIYQVHFYEPFDFTHFSWKKKSDIDSGKVIPRVYPGSYYGTYWGSDLVQIRKKLAYVRAFEKQHKAKIYIGEFSAFACAPGADQYLADCIRIFEEYGWDWTYHAFREANMWSVEHEGPALDSMKKVSDSPRKRVLLNAFRKNIEKK